MNSVNYTQFNKSLAFFFFATILLGFQGCSDDDTPTPAYVIPPTYSFENVSYTGQSDRLGMMQEWKEYMASSQTQGISLDAVKMKAMFENSEGSGFSRSYTKQIKSKTFEFVHNAFDLLIDELAETSQSTVAGSSGISGVITSLDGTKSYLIGADGLDHAQIIEKGLMGACFYYQATSIYFGDDRMNADNETIEPGEGTDMEHHWDEAFGYLGVPKTFPADKDGLFFWGSYTDKRNEVLSSNQTIMDAMLKGRAAISNNDLDARDEAIMEARNIWELIAVGSALHYLNDGIANFDDKAISSHGLSEAIGFVYSLQFNTTKKISNEQVGELLSLIAGSSSFNAMNLYETNVDNLQSAKDKLATYYNLESQKDDF